MEPGIYYGNFREYTLNLQVWRPSPTAVDGSTGTGCYSLVGNNRFQFTNNDLSDGAFRISPSPQDYIQFQPGDVLGFYVEDANDGENGVVALTIDSYTRESVWYAIATSQTVPGCPISVGSAGDLNTMLRGAPVISISTGTLILISSFFKLTIINFDHTSRNVQLSSDISHPYTISYNTISHYYYGNGRANRSDTSSQATN